MVCECYMVCSHTCWTWSVCKSKWALAAAAVAKVSSATAVPTYIKLSNYENWLIGLLFAQISCPNCHKFKVWASRKRLWLINSRSRSYKLFPFFPKCRLLSLIFPKSESLTRMNFNILQETNFGRRAVSTRFFFKDAQSWLGSSFCVTWKCDTRQKVEPKAIIWIRFDGHQTNIRNGSRDPNKKTSDLSHFENGSISRSRRK